MTDTNYPLTAIRFAVGWKGADPKEEGNFAEASGLSVQIEADPYRGGADRTLDQRKLPGLMKSTNLVLKRGILKADSDFFDWWQQGQQGALKARDLRVALLNEEGKETVVWSVRLARPIKIDGPSMNATGNDVAIESIEFIHEGIAILSS